MTYKVHTQRKFIVDRFLFWHNREIQKLINKLSVIYNHSKMKVFEIGGGPQTLEKYFSRTSFIVFDIELYPDIQGLGDIINLPFQNEVFDLVICNNVLEHIFQPIEAISELYRVLKVKGQLLLVTPFLFPIHDPPYDFFRYTKYSLLKMLNKFSEVQIKEIPLHPIPGPFFKRFILYYVTVAQK